MRLLCCRSPHERTRGVGLAGWTYPDEPDNNGWTPASLAKAHPYERGNADGLVTFLTTTGRFFQHAPYGSAQVPLSRIRRVRAARRHGRIRSLSAERLPVGSHSRVRRAGAFVKLAGSTTDVPVDRDRPDPSELLRWVHHDARAIEC